MKPTLRRLKTLSLVLALAAQLSPHPTWAQDGERKLSDQELKETIRKASGLEGLLNSVGLKNTKIVAQELQVNAASG